jgi:LDH2 family malate/lactate/ureidoglycolate dehydrogenase
VNGLRNGEVDPNPEIVVLRDAPVAAAWDSGRGFGPVVAHRAMETAIAKAEVTGVGMGDRAGRAALRVQRLLRRDGHPARPSGDGRRQHPVVGFAPGGLQPVVGTNPFAFAAPVGDRPPLVVELLGGQVAGHKGYGLALVVDALGMLAGNGAGIWQATSPPQWS